MKLRSWNEAGEHVHEWRGKPAAGRVAAMATRCHHGGTDRPAQHFHDIHTNGMHQNFSE